jgi:TRAP-type mannitol/chloroaromatic compound transport system permease small subunit
MAGNDRSIELDLEKVEDAGARGHALAFPRTWISDRIEAVVEAVGSLVNWLWIALVVIIVGTVLMRHFIGGNTIAIEETQWHLYAIGYMLGVGYAVKHDAHVRVDVLAMNLRRRTRAIIEVLGILLLVFPVILYLIPEAVNFTVASLRNNEISSSPGGLTNRWAIKGVIILALVYLGLAAFARLTRVLAFLYGSYGGRPLAPPAQATLNAVLVIAVLGVALTPGWRLYNGAAPPARDVERLVAQHYDLRRIRTENITCRGALPFSFERTTPSATKVWAKPWRCTVEGLELPGVDAERRAFGAEITDGAAITGEVLVGWLFPRGSRRSAYVLMSNPDESGARPDLRMLGAQ